VTASNRVRALLDGLYKEACETLERETPDRAYAALAAQVQTGAGEVAINRALLELLIEPEGIPGLDDQYTYRCLHCPATWTDATPEQHESLCPVPHVRAYLPAQEAK